MSGPRFGNKREKKAKVETPELIKNETEKPREEMDIQIAVASEEEQSDILAFMEESQKKKKTIPMRQIIFRLPLDKFERVEKAMGSMSIQDFFSNLTDFYLSKMDNPER